MFLYIGSLQALHTGVEKLLTSQKMATVTVLCFMLHFGHLQKLMAVDDASILLDAFVVPDDDSMCGFCRGRNYEFVFRDASSICHVFDVFYNNADIQRVLNSFSSMDPSENGPPVRGIDGSPLLNENYYIIRSRLAKQHFLTTIINAMLLQSTQEKYSEVNDIDFLKLWKSGVNLTSGCISPIPAGRYELLMTLERLIANDILPVSIQEKALTIIRPSIFNSLPEGIYENSAKKLEGEFMYLNAQNLLKYLAVKTLYESKNQDEMMNLLIKNLNADFADLVDPYAIEYEIEDFSTENGIIEFEVRLKGREEFKFKIKGFHQKPTD